MFCLINYAWLFSGKGYSILYSLKIHGSVSKMLDPVLHGCGIAKSLTRLPSTRQVPGSILCQAPEGHSLLSNSDEENGNFLPSSVQKTTLGEN